MSTILIALLAVACSDSPRTVEEWETSIWLPVSTDVPAPEDATPEVCQTSLVKIREQIQSNSVAPDPELQEAFEKWLEAAQSLTFECASNAEDFSYVDNYAEVERLSEQIGRILEDMGLTP
jgi:transcription initiation factor IIE alpha subunit